MSEHSTKNKTHAAQGRTRLRNTSLEKPDTIIFLPDGKTLTLSRPSEKMPVFRKFNPKKYDPSTGRSRKAKQQEGGKSKFAPPSQIPFSKFLLAAFLLHHVVSAARDIYKKWKARRDQRLGIVQEGDEWEGEHNLDPEVAAAETKLQAELLPAMMRAAMPKPNRRNAAKEAAHARKSRPRHVPTASSMMQPSQNVKAKKAGMLGRLDKTMRQHVRQLTIAQQQSQQLQLEAGQRMLALQAAAVQQQSAVPDIPLQNGHGTDQPTRVVIEPAAQPVRKR